MSDTIIVALIVGANAIVVASIGLIGSVVVAQGRRVETQTKETHLLINSRMTELLHMASTLARAEGVAQGEQSQRDRSAPAE